MTGDGAADRAALLEEAIEALAEGFALYDADDRLVTCNQRYRDLNEASADALAPGARWIDFMRIGLARGQYPEAAGREDDWLAERARQRATPGAPFEVEFAGGRWIRVADWPMRGGGRVAIRTDITDLKQEALARVRQAELLQGVLETISDGVLAVDAAGRLIAANRKLRPILGLAADAPLDGEIAALVQAVGAAAGPARAERTTPDGRFLLLRANPLAGGGAVGTYSDVTARQRAERERETERRRLVDAIESLDEGFVLYDAADRLVACNGRFRELYGLSAAECAPGTTWRELLDMNVARGCYRDAIGREPAWVAERERRRKAPGGSYEIGLSNGGWLRASDRATRDGGMVSIRVDITAQKATEERLRAMEREARASEERLREIVDANPVPMTITRVSDGRVVYANQRAADMVGMPLDQAIGTRSRDFYVHPEDRETVRRLLRSEGKAELEVEFRRADGSVFPLVLICRSIAYGGEPAIVSGLHDLTEWRRMEETLRQTEKMAALGSLLAGVAHELNNPLSVVVGQATLMEETAADPKVSARAEKIRLAAERCSRIVRTFLALARQRRAAPTFTDLGQVARAAVELLGYQLRTADIEIELDVAPGLPELWADADQLHQVATNLIVNASQALAEAPMPRRLRIAVVHDREARALRLTVADNGPGIKSDIRSRIFEPFFTTKEPGGGTGIGLSMCLSIVTGHGGSISVEDTPGGGATFVVVLPLRPAEAAGAEPADPASAAGRQPAPARILIVDDEPEIAATLAEMLEADGHRADIAENGRAALARLAAEAYDAVISDLRMPVLDGPGLYRAVAETRPALLPRLAFVTGDALSAGIQSFLAETRAPCLEKPFVRSEVRQLLARLLPAG